jgi:dephospho-CoA kinase
MRKKVLIVGITGLIGAGKGTVVEYLVEKGKFKHFSASGFITEEIVRRNLPVDRDSMILVGNDLRQKFGAGYVVEELLKRAEGEKRAVIESIRTLGEVEKIRKNNGILLAVDADQKIRYERNIKRNSNKDKVSFEKFMEQEKRELDSTDPNKQNLQACVRVADYVIENNRTIEELNQKVKEILKIIEK